MKKLFLTAAAACAVAAPAMAEEAAGWSFSGNIALTSDYVFRGISQTLEDPAVQGGFDAAYGSFYAGVWASNVDFGVDESIEIDYYAGFKPTLGPVAADLGVAYYTYPGAGDDGAEYDYVELYAKGSVAPVEKMSLGAAVFYSPEYTGETGAAYYVEANAGFTVIDALSVSGAVGFQDVEEGVFGEDNYTTWNLGGTYSLAGFGLDLRYHDTDYDGLEIAEERVVVTLKRAL